MILVGILYIVSAISFCRQYYFQQ
uniref:Uncharacterized protein n=1 Tax=Arundo donax TaxID=35708 RepID=A0A0A9C1R9_ARUDO